MAIAPYAQVSAADATNGHEPADVLVVFGITGDLAKVMTFHSLYRLEFAEQGGEGPTPYEVLLLAAMLGDSTRFTRQDTVEETWRVLQPLLDSSSEPHSYAKGSWGPEAAEKLVAHHGGWHGPWVGS
jgi:glucose-6-phosphate 1-dehydrogenase